MPIAGGTQWRQNERLLAGGESDHKRRRHSGNNSGCGKLALAEIAELHSLCQSFVVWFSMLRVAIYLIGILFLISTADLIASGPTQQPGNVNRKQAVDTVAQAFERTRASAMLPALERIPAQKSMTQLLCTTALTGQKTFDPDSLYGEGALYRTSVLSKVTPELQHAALTRAFNGNGRPRRYAVAVWEARDHTPERPDFWVSVELYDTAFHDWVALRFTTDRLFGLGLNDWKRLVIPPCGAVE